LTELSIVRTSTSGSNGLTITASGPSRDCGAAEIWRIAENAPRRSDLIVQPLLNIAVERLPCAILAWLEAYEGLAKRLDSEQFRFAPKTVETSIGKLEMRQTD
jgi:hypothetical protein